MCFPVRRHQTQPLNPVTLNLREHVLLAAEQAYPNLLARWQQERSRVHFMAQPAFSPPFQIVINDAVVTQKQLGLVRGRVAALRWYRQSDEEMPLLRTGWCRNEEEALRALGRMASEARKARK